MSTLFVGLDVGSTTFHQVLMQPDGVTKATRPFPMSEANLNKNISHCEYTQVSTKTHIRRCKKLPSLRFINFLIIFRVKAKPIKLTPADSSD